MSDEPALYRPNRAEIAALCADLRAAGVIGPGPDPELRLDTALTRLGPRSRDGLRAMVHAICRTTPERIAVDAIVAPWLGELRPVVTPQMGRRRAVASAPIGGAAAPAAAEPTPRWPVALAVAVALLVALAFVTGEPESVTDAGAPDAISDAIADTTGDASDASIAVIGDTWLGDGSATDGTDGTADGELDAIAALDGAPADAAHPDATPLEVRRAARRPTLAGRPELIPTEHPPLPLVAAHALLLLAIGLLALFIARLRRLRPVDPGPEPAPPETPPAPLPPPKDPPPRYIPRDADSRLAAGAGRTTTDPQSRVVDIAASVRATAARAGLVPVLRYRALRRDEPLHLWVDHPARRRTPALARAVDELTAALTRAAVDHTRLLFTHRPDHLVDAGRPVTLDGLPGDRAATRVALITDGCALLRLRGRERREVIQRLARWPQAALFVFGRHEPTEIAEHLDHAIPVRPGDALLPWLLHATPAHAPLLDAADLHLWAAACALAPRGCHDDDAHELRQALALRGVPPTAIEALRADADAGGRLHWPPRRRAELLNWLSQHRPRRLDAALADWRARYARRLGESAADPTHHAEWRLQAHTLDLWRPAAAIPATAAALEACERLHEARELLARLVPADFFDPRHPEAIRLPWRWHELTDPDARRRLRALGLAAAVAKLPHDEWQRPPRAWPLLGLAAGLAFATALSLDRAPPDTALGEVPCVDHAPAADGTRAEFWRCGDRLTARPEHPDWPTHSAVTLAADPSDPDAAELALALLDHRAADAVWWGAMPPGDIGQRVHVSVGAGACPPRATACVRAPDWTTLRDALGPEPRPLAAVWPGVERGEGLLTGRPIAPDAGPPDAALDAAVDAAIADAQPSPDAIADPFADATPALTRLTRLDITSTADHIQLTVTHDAPSPIERVTATPPHGTALIVTFPAARWTIDGAPREVTDPDLARVQATNQNQLWLRFRDPPPPGAAPAIEATEGQVTITLDRAALAPPDAGPPPDADAGAPDVGPPDAGPPPAFVRLPGTAARPAMVPIRPGRFMMGSPTGEAGRFTEEQRHTVTLTRGFWIAETEVTQAQYAAVTGRNPSFFQGTAEDGRRPVESVSWLDAVRYCNALSAREGLPSAYTINGDEVAWDRGADGYRLPTEAEWEFAARAGTRGATYAGDPMIMGANNAPMLDGIAWYGGNSGSEHPRAWDSSGWSEKQEAHTRASTQPVKGKRANGWGLYDMLGNVYEWVWDWHGAYSSGEQTDPSGPLHGVRRVVRGGSCLDDARWVRAAHRGWGLPDFRGGDLGFRPVRSAPRARGGR